MPLSDMNTDSCCNIYYKMTPADGNCQKGFVEAGPLYSEFMTFSDNHSFNQSLTPSVPLYLCAFNQVLSGFARNPGQNLRGGLSQERSCEHVLQHNLGGNSLN